MEIQFGENPPGHRTANAGTVARNSRLGEREEEGCWKKAGKPLEKKGKGKGKGSWEGVRGRDPETEIKNNPGPPSNLTQ